MCTGKEMEWSGVFDTHTYVTNLCLVTIYHDLCVWIHEDDVYKRVKRRLNKAFQAKPVWKPQTATVVQSVFASSTQCKTSSNVQPRSVWTGKRFLGQKTRLSKYTNLKRATSTESVEVSCHHPSRTGLEILQCDPAAECVTLQRFCPCPAVQCQRPIEVLQMMEQYPRHAK